MAARVALAAEEEAEMSRAAEAAAAMQAAQAASDASNAAVDAILLEVEALAAAARENAAVEAAEFANKSSPIPAMSPMVRLSESVAGHVDGAPRTPSVQAETSVAAQQQIDEPADSGTLVAEGLAQQLQALANEDHQDTDRTTVVPLPTHSYEEPPAASASAGPQPPQRPKPPRPPAGEPRDLDESAYTDRGYDGIDDYEEKQLAYEERLLDYEESLMEFEMNQPTAVT